jgi:hypothetical protein
LDLKKKISNSDTRNQIKDKNKTISVITDERAHVLTSRDMNEQLGDAQLRS